MVLVLALPLGKPLAFWCSPVLLALPQVPLALTPLVLLPVSYKHSWPQLSLLQPKPALLLPWGPEEERQKTLTLALVASHGWQAAQALALEVDGEGEEEMHDLQLAVEGVEVAEEVQVAQAPEAEEELQAVG